MNFTKQNLCMWLTVSILLPAIATTNALAQNTSPAAITETDLAKITLRELQLGMLLPQVKQQLQQYYVNSNRPDNTAVAAFQCGKQQCQAQRQAADGSEALLLQFNQQQQLYWIQLSTQKQFGASNTECLQFAEQQLAELRQQYSPSDSKHFYGPNTVSLLLNKQGHPDPADNSLHGFRVQIKCDPFAKGMALTEFSLRDDALLSGGQLQPQDPEQN